MLVTLVAIERIDEGFTDVELRENVSCHGQGLAYVVFSGGYSECERSIKRPINRTGKSQEVAACSHSNKELNVKDGMSNGFLRQRSPFYFLVSIYRLSEA